MRLNVHRLVELARENVFALSAALALAALLSLGVRWITSHRGAPPGPRKVVTITGVIMKPPEPMKPTAPPPPPVVRPKQMDEPQRSRVEMKDLPPLNAPPPPQNAPGGGRLSLAAEATGEGDAFNLAGNPGGRGLLSGGGLGDGVGGGIGSGTGSRYAWYYAKIASELEQAFRKSSRLRTAETRVEMRVWADSSGRITRVQLV